VPGAAQALVLASRSPQRRAILAQLGIAFEVFATDVEEITAGDPVEVARTNALAKALSTIVRIPHLRSREFPIFGWVVEAGSEGREAGAVAAHAVAVAVDLKHGGVV
jgi:predicted house-cleaning NTP pyrophosphatase (Maf/HAM1 superfamily)